MYHLRVELNCIERRFSSFMAAAGVLSVWAMAQKPRGICSILSPWDIQTSSLPARSGKKIVVSSI
jgi:hypothetical protein